MDLLACGHAAVAGPSRMCRHLLGSEGEDHVDLWKSIRFADADDQHATRRVAKLPIEQDARSANETILLR